MTRLLLCLSMATLSMQLQSRGDAREEAAYKPPDCGTNALFLLMSLSGCDVSLANLQTALPQPDDLGYSMSDLTNAAHQCGLELVGGSIDKSCLPLQSPVMAHFDRHRPASGHFVLLRPVGKENKLVQIIDPPYAPRIFEYHFLLGNKGQSLKILRPQTAIERHRWLAWGLLLVLGTSCVAFRAFVNHRSKKDVSHQ